MARSARRSHKKVTETSTIAANENSEHERNDGMSHSEFRIESLFLAPLKQ